MQMLKNLLSSDNKYYLELDEAKDNAVQTASKVTDAVKEKAEEVAKSQPVQQVVETATEVAETAQEKLASAITEEKAAETKPVAAKAKSNAKSKQNGTAAKSAAEVKQTKATSKNSGASSYEPPFWVAAMYNNNGSATNDSGQVSEGTFATDNLMPTVTTYRRRPGASMAKFRDMARTARTPKG